MEKEKFMKTELEEAAENWLKSKTLIKTSQAPGLLVGFIEGAKYVAERMYSEEEVNQIVLKTVDKYSPIHSQELKMQIANEWFEQFKNK